MKELVIQKNDAGQRIDKYLKKLLCNAPESFIYKMFRKKDVKVNGTRVKESYILKKDDVVSLFLYEDKFLEFTREKSIVDIDITFDVLYEDEHILVVYKPVGLLVHEDENESLNTLSNQVLKYLYDKGEYDLSRDATFTPGPVHRLDRNTSGIVIFGKTLDALQDLNEMMKVRNCIEKTYLTITHGFTEDGEITGYIKKLDDKAQVKLVKKDTPGALSMLSKVHRIQYKNGYSLVEVMIITGRMHQIRISLSSVDTPVIGDRKYGDFENNKYIKQKYGLNSQLLHAYKIKFIHPIGSLQYLQDKEITCPIPNKFKEIKESLF